MQRKFHPIPALNGTITDVKSLISGTCYLEQTSYSNKTCHSADDTQCRQGIQPALSHIANKLDSFTRIRSLRNDRKRNAAFTLAETLITLMVIGVVAALTVPSLMTAYKDKQLDTAKKKAKSILGNGYKKMIVEEETAFSDLPIFKCGEDFSCLSEVHRKIFNIASEKTKTNDSMPESYQKSDSTDEADFKWEDVPYIFTTTDGMTYGFLAEEGKETLDIVVDINGDKSPNKVKEDIIKLRINNQGTVVDVSFELDGLCSAKGIANCTNDEDIDKIFDAGSFLGGDKEYSCTKLSNGKYLTIIDKNYDGGQWAYHCENQGKINIGSHYCYAIDDGYDDWSSYCD